MIVNSASVRKSEDGHHVVHSYKEFLCPACGRCMCHLSSALVGIKIRCIRCRAIWKLEDGKTSMIAPPKKLDGKMLLNWSEKFVNQELRSQK